MIADSISESSQESGSKIRAADVPREIQIMNSYAILETFMITVGFLKRMTCRDTGSILNSEFKLPNGTTVPLNRATCFPSTTNELVWAVKDGDMDSSRGKEDFQRL
jgi:hypothetical protein